MSQLQIDYDVIIIGAGAAGLFCAAKIGQAGKKVCVLDNGKRIGRKILMSGGGYCNFTNLTVTPSHYISRNPHFAKSALARYTQWHFISLVEQYQIAYHEKEDGQLFCDESAQQIVDLLESECRLGHVDIRLRQSVTEVQHCGQTRPHFAIKLQNQITLLRSHHLIIATGGLSMPGLGASAFGYQIAEQFNLPIVPPRASLVPFTWKDKDRYYAQLAGVSLPVVVTANNGQFFQQHMLFTHRGLSGPAMLQISNYWQPGESLSIDLLPQQNISELLFELKNTSPKMQIKTALARVLPNRLVELWREQYLFLNQPLAQLSKVQLTQLDMLIHQWQFEPNGTEGYRTAEVTLGGVDTSVISSKTMQVNHMPGLYFIGEVLDVTGWLGGYNFQWAWSSAYVCAEAIIAQDKIASK